MSASQEHGNSGHPPKEVHEYDDIPGTVVFDAQRSRLGYNLNQFLYSLMKAENRKAFLADESTYLDQFKLMPSRRRPGLSAEGTPCWT